MRNPHNILREDIIKETLAQGVKGITAANPKRLLQTKWWKLGVHKCSYFIKRGGIKCSRTPQRIIGRESLVLQAPIDAPLKMSVHIWLVEVQYMNLNLFSHKITLCVFFF